MVMLVWWILSLFGVCSFTWLPVFIDAIIVALSSAVHYSSASEDEDLLSELIWVSITLGIAAFAFYKFFFGLTISAWWILAAPIAIIIIFFVPGGFTITNLLFKYFGLMTLPTWGFIVGIVIDVFTVIALIISFAHGHKNIEE
ncbi:MAG: hypothetical protein ACI396_07315 [Acutalibacteraceae bacterium]